MEEELHESDGLAFGQRHLDPQPNPVNDLDQLDDKDLKRVRAVADDKLDDDADITDPQVKESLDLERAYQALAEHRPDLLNPAVFQDKPEKPKSPPTSAAAAALRAMDAREQILSSVSGFGDEARSTALSVLAGTPPEALTNPFAIDLITNFAIGEAVRAGRMASVSGPASDPAPVSRPGHFRGIAAFESIFGNTKFSDSERAELRAIGL